MSETIRASVTATTRGHYDFPERSDGSLPPNSGNCGICFSGGGTRSLSASMGQLRGLHRHGLIGNARYVSCVSGGSWAAAAYTFYKDGPSDDDQLLGPDPTSQERAQWSLHQWGDSLKPHQLGFPATSDFISVLEAHLLDGTDSMAWARAVRDVYFAPYGLAATNYTAPGKEAVRAICERNPQLSAEQFDVPREGRPYLIVNGTLLWPVELLHRVQRVLVEFTPGYVGNPNPLQLKNHWSLFNRHLETGGGFLDAFAFGSPGPSAPAGSWLPMPRPSEPFSIWHASGISSAAYGYDFAKFDQKWGLPQMTYWAAERSAESAKLAREQKFSDGGNLENLGVMALLQRGVERIVIFVNSSTPIVGSDGGTQLDADIGPLFGRHSGPMPNNQVFPTECYPELRAGLAEAYAQGGLCFFEASYQTVGNEWFGIGNQSVEVMWVYNAPVRSWVGLLDESVRNAIEQGVAGGGKLAHFPNYKTIDEDSFATIALTPTQVALLADMFSWSIQNDAAARGCFERFLAPSPA